MELGTMKKVDVKRCKAAVQQLLEVDPVFGTLANLIEMYEDLKVAHDILVKEHAKCHPVVAEPDVAVDHAKVRAVLAVDPARGSGVTTTKTTDELGRMTVTHEYADGRKTVMHDVDRTGDRYVVREYHPDGSECYLGWLKCDQGEECKPGALDE